MIIGYGGIKIKRKVVLHGDSTLTISLPARWAKKFNIKKGDELNVEENEREIRITNDKEITLDKKQFSVGNLRRLGISYITSLYRSGYDEIHLDYNNNDYIETIHDVLSNEITGFEIVKHSSSFPSGHTTLAAAIFGLMAFFILKAFSSYQLSFGISKGSQN